MTMTPAGDMANALFLRRQTATLKTAMTRHSQELTTGRFADPLRGLRGNTAALAALERSRTALSSFRLVTTEAGMHTAGQQNVLEKLRASSIDIASQLFNFGSAVPPQMVQTAARIGAGAFEDAVTGLNSRVSDRSLFAGAASDGPALKPAAEIVALLKAEIHGVTTAEEVAERVFAWFDTGGGGFETSGLAFAWPATPQGEGPLAIAPGERISLTVTAGRSELRPALAGLALAAVVDAGALAGDFAARADLLQRAAVRLAGASVGLTALAGEVGDTEARIARAAARNTNELTALDVALNGLIGVDTLDAATRLEETRVRLESLFAMTARLQRMSLTEFLR